jgi:glycosyltransferase involved in cell wall biosynthesis
LRVCVISFKECWQEPDGTWHSTGGFPMQMRAIGSLFDDMTLLVVAVPRASGGSPLPSGAEVIPLPSPSGEDLQRKLSVVRHLADHLSLMRRHVLRADVVHTPLPGDLALLGFLTGAAHRRRLLVRYGGSWERTSESTAMNSVTRMLMRALAGRRNVMLATGAGGGQPAPGIHWMFTTAVSSDEVKAIQPDLQRARAVPLRVAYAGRLSSEKGVRYLIDALGILHRRVGAPPVALTLLGGGSERRELEQQACEQGVTDLVCFRGQVGRTELLQELLRSDLCVLPSLTESFCKARLDAMLCGVPVVTTPVGFGRALIGPDGERGWLVPPKRADLLADRLAAVAVEPSDYSSLRTRCRRFAENYTVEAWARAIGEICSSQWRMRLVNGKLLP